MPQYMLTVHDVEGQAAPPPDAIQKMYADVDALNQQIRSSGSWVFAGGLHPYSTASVVQVKDGDVLVTDGPFMEGKEHVGGFWVLKCADLDEALDWAKKATVACAGPVEVRPFQDEPEG